MSGPTCSVDGCETDIIFSRGWCNRHYKRWWRHGDPLAGATAPGSLRRWLEEAVLQDTEECIDGWPYGLVDGYPNMTIARRNTYLNRYVCERFNGPPPTPEHQAAHRCGNRKCLNWRHLRWATNAENQADRRLHGTDLRGEDCPWSKLDDDIIRGIRSARAAGETCASVAARYDVCAMTVSLIARRKSWAHVD